jgi:ribonuclease P protein component
VLILLANGTRTARFGVIASRKVGSAVIRNRCKRMLREAARGLMKKADLS